MSAEPYSKDENTGENSLAPTTWRTRSQLGRSTPAWAIVGVTPAMEMRTSNPRIEETRRFEVMRASLSVGDSTRPVLQM